MRRLDWSLGFFLLAGPVWGGASPPLPIGNEFQVNGVTLGSQRYPAVSVAADGAFAVVWESDISNGGDADGKSIQGQRFGAGGAALGGPFQVNSYTTSPQDRPAISLSANGDFVVVWSSYGSSGTDTSSRSVQGQRYAADGALLGGQFQINAYTSSFQFRPAVALSAEGDFVVVWDSLGSSGGDSSLQSVQGQRYSAGGAALGGEFEVNTYTPNNQFSPSVSLSAGGDFLVVWAGNGSSGDPGSNSIQGQRYAAEGGALGTEFRVNTYTSGIQEDPAVALSAEGDFVVVWHSNGSSGGDTSDFSIQGQRYAASGGALGGEFQVNTYTSNNQFAAAVAADVDGDFVVVWNSAGSSGGDTSYLSIQGQRYAASGAVLGGQFQVNTYTEDNQAHPAVAVSADGDFVVVWDSLGSSGDDSSSYSIQGQRFLVTGELRGTVFFDADANGLQAQGEPGIEGVKVELHDESLALRRTVLTDGLGEYHLRPKEGNWLLRFVAPPSWFTGPDVGGDDTVDSDADPLTGETAFFPVTINVLDTTIDAGLLYFPIFRDGFETNNTNHWSTTLP